MRKLGFIKKLGFIIGIIVLLMAVMPMSGGLAVQADDPPGWYYKPGNWTDYALSGMPDFDQKQDAWTNPITQNWSYCGPVAVANCLWWFDSANDPNPPGPPSIKDNYTMVTSYNPGGWDDHHTSNVEPLVNELAYWMDTDGQRTGSQHSGTNVHDMEWGIDVYLLNRSFYGPYYEKTVQWPDFYWIEDEVERCEDVILLLGFYRYFEVEPELYYFERVGGHYVTVAGVNSNATKIGLSDPYWDNAEAGGPGRVPVAHAYPHNATVHNDTQYVSHDTYDVVQIPPPFWPLNIPPGTWALQNYAVGKDITNFTGLNGGGSDPGIGELMTIIDYAVAVSPKPDINDVIDSDYNWTELQEGGNVTITVHVTNETWNNTIYDMEILFWTDLYGTEWVKKLYFMPPLKYCQTYNFTVWYPFPPELVVLHFSNEADENIGFAFSYPYEEPEPEGWYWKPGNWTDYALSGVPDFDQKQDLWYDPAGGQWYYCGPVAVANSLWYFDSREEPLPVSPPTINDNYGLVTAYGPWDDHNPQNVEPLVNHLAGLMGTNPLFGTSVFDMQRGIDQYLVDTGYYGYYYEHTEVMPDFYWIEDEVERCEDVVLLLGFWQTLDDPWDPQAYWWRIGGHYVTCAGVNSNTSQLGISDPYLDNAEATGQGIVLPPCPPHPPAGHNANVHNDTWYVSHDIYNVTISPSPGGIWGLEGYADSMSPTDFWNFENRNLEQTGYYEPGIPVFTEIEYAVAVSPKEDLNDVIDSDYNVTEQDGVSIRVHVTNEIWNNTIWDMDVLLWNSTTGTQVPWPHLDFQPPLQYCQNYTFNVTCSVPPEEVVLHFSNETGDNIGFAFSHPAGEATLVGNVTFVGRGSDNAQWVENFTVRFFDNATTIETGWSPIIATTNTTGFFTISGLTPGTYDIGIKGGTGLSELEFNVVLAGTTVVDFGTIRVGDSNNDDYITISDRTLLYGCWGTAEGAPGWNGNCDFNNDGFITISDRTLLYGNWNEVGDLIGY